MANNVPEENKKLISGEIKPASGLNLGNPTTVLQHSQGVWLVSLLLFIFVVWVFLPSWEGNFLFYDDNAYVVGNSHINSGLSWTNFLWSIRTLYAANWHPLTWLSHMLDVQLYGLDPRGHHLTNVLLHALNTVLVFLVFRRMTGANWRSLAVGCLFGLHPLRVESVAWISERKDVLSTMFWLLAMWAYTRFAEESRAPDGKPKSFYWLTLLLFALGLTSKTMLVTLPWVFLLLDFWPLKRWEQTNKWRLVAEKIPFFVLSIAVSVTAYIAQQRFGAMQEMMNLSWNDRIGNALISYVRYLGKFFWPENLCSYYPHPGHWPMAGVLPAGLFLGAASIFAWVRRTQWPYLFTGWFWFIGTLIPVINLVQLYSQSMADRYTYVPMLGVYLFSVWGLCELTKFCRNQATVVTLILGAALCGFTVLTRYEIRFWKNDITVWSRAIAVTRDNYVAHNNIGPFFEPQYPDIARREIQEAVRINPNYVPALRNLAHEFYQSGNYDRALVYCRKAVEIRPGDAVAHYALGLIFFQKGQINEAAAEFRSTIKLQPDFANSHVSLGETLVREGRLDEAMIQYQIALKLDPNSATIYYHLGNALVKKNQIAEAMTNYQKAVEIEPNWGEPHNNLGGLLLYSGHSKEAIKEFQEALKWEPDNRDVQTNLNLALELQKRAMTNQPASERGTSP